MQLHALRDRLRPVSLDDVIGNRQAVEFLRGMIANKRLEHLLFFGPIGSGKSTFAEIVRRGLVDDYWRAFLKPRMNASQYSGIDFIRGLLEYKEVVGLKPFILDEAHALSRQAQTALLSAMEDPSSNCLFIFCTSEPFKLLSALRRRCRKIQLQPLAPAERAELIARGWKTLRGDEPVPQDFIDAIDAAALDSPALILNALDDVATGMPAIAAVSSAQLEVEHSLGETRGTKTRALQLPESLVRRAAEMYRQGKSWRDIKREFGLSHTAKLREAMRGLGVFTEGKSGKSRNVDWQRVIELRKAGNSGPEIAALLGASSSEVYHILRTQKKPRSRK